MNRPLLKLSLSATTVTALTLALAGPDRATEYTNKDRIVNTGHNMTQRSLSDTFLLSGGPSSGGNGSTFNPTFLRKTNAASLVCLTCHTK